MTRWSSITLFGVTLCCCATAIIGLGMSGARRSVAATAAAPVRPSTIVQPMTFMEIGDPQMGMYLDNAGSAQEITNLTAIVQNANHIIPAFVIICGDFVNESTDQAELDAFANVISQLHPSIPLYLVPGNHDVGNIPTPASVSTYRRIYHEYLTNTALNIDNPQGLDYYTFTQGNIFGIVLDSMLFDDAKDPADSNAQWSWLQQVLPAAAAAGYSNIVLFQHIPFFLSSPTEGDSYWNVPSAVRGKYLALLEKYGVNFVVAGHLHYNNRATDGRLVVLSNGPAGKPLGDGVSGMQLIQPQNPGWRGQYYPLSSLPTSLTLTSPVVLTAN